MKNVLPNLVIKKVYSATTMFSKENAVKKQIDRSSWAVLIKYEGETEYISNGKKYISNINNMVILPKGSDYEWRCTKAGHYSVIQFDAEPSVKEISSFSVKNGEKILGIFKSLEHKRLTKKPFYEMESIKDTYSVILKLMIQSEDYYVPNSKKEKLAPAIEYILENYDKSVSNDDLAEKVGFSAVYFRKLFAEVYGTSPINYIKKLRMKKAKEMLFSDYGSITDIALSLGYPNIYDFSRDFKKHVGVSPSKFK